MVGRAVSTYWSAAGDECTSLIRTQLDITDAEAVRTVFENVRPEVVINCAAWTDVDACESDPNRAHSVNTKGPEILASQSRNIGALFISLSTDFVFDGEKRGFYTQRDDPNPVSVYAKAKLEGERRAQAASARTIIVRSGWIFGIGGRNFLSRIIELAQNGGPLKVISDSFGTPTCATNLAARLRELAILDLPGIYHVTNSGAGSSYAGFARVALNAAGLHSTVLEEVSMTDLNRPAQRPRNSRLRCLLSEALNLTPLPNWETSLRTFVEQQSLERN